MYIVMQKKKFIIFYVSSAEQAEILQVTKEKIENQSIETNVEKHQNETFVGLNKEKKTN